MCPKTVCWLVVIKYFVGSGEIMFRAMVLMERIYYIVYQVRLLTSACPWPLYETLYKTFSNYGITTIQVTYSEMQGYTPDIYSHCFVISTVR